MMRDWLTHLKARHRCVLVGKGPSAAEARAFLAAAHLATINDVCRLFAGPIDWAFFTDREPLEVARPSWERVRSFVLPSRLHIGCAPSSQTPVDVPGLPLTRVLVYPHFLPGETRDAIEAAVRKEKPALCCTAAVALQTLAAAGYREILCCGLDGGVGTTGEVAGLPQPTPAYDYSHYRRMCEWVATALQEKYGAVVRFWPERFAWQPAQAGTGPHSLS